MPAESTRKSTFVAVVFPHWPIQRFLTENTFLKDQPVVLYGKMGRRQVVTGCNRLASRLGARVGLPMVQLPRRLAGAAIRHSAEDDLRRLNELAMDFRQFTPFVGLQTNRWDFPSQDSILLDVTRSVALFGSAANLEKSLANVCNDLGYRTQIASGETVGSAWALARFGSAVKDRESVEDRNRLLPVAALRTDSKNVQNLNSLGIETIGQLLELPQASLPSRFGQGLCQRIAEYSGQRKEEVHPVSLREPDLWKHSLEHPSGDSEVLNAVIVALMKKVLKPIEDRQEGVLSLSVRLFCRSKSTDSDRGGVPVPPCDEDGTSSFGAMSFKEVTPLDFSIELVRPTLDVDYLYSLLSVSLERMKLTRPVSHLQVFVGRTVPYKRKQTLLFQGQKDTSVLATSKLVDLLTCRLGADAVVQATNRQHALPERTFAWETPLKKRRKGRRYLDVPAGDRAADQRVAARLEQPSRLFQKPIPLIVKQSVYQNIRPTGDQRFCVPGQFQIKKKNYRIVFVAGPNQVDSLWWEGDSVHRKYYRITTDQGLRFLVFQATDTGCWFLHGDFA